MVSGAIRSLNGTQRSLKELLTKKLKRLMYPYCIISFMYCLFHFFISFVGFEKNVVIMDLTETVTLWGIGPLWFLPTLFLSEMFFEGLLRIRVGLRCFLLSVILFLGIVGSSTLEQYYESIVNHTCSFLIYSSVFFTRIHIAILFLFIGYGGLYFCTMILPKLSRNTGIAIGICGLVIGLWVGTLNSDIVDLHFGFIRNPLITFSSSTVCCFSLVLILNQLPFSRFFVWLGKNTLLFMGLQIGTGYYVYFTRRINQLMNIRLSDNVKVVSDLLGFLIISSILVFFIEKYLPWIYKLPEGRKD